jgi:hypothetical protein
MREQIECVTGRYAHIHIREALLYVKWDDVIIQHNNMLIATNITRTVLYVILIMFELGTQTDSVTFIKVCALMHDNHNGSLLQFDKAGSRHNVKIGQGMLVNAGYVGKLPSFV